MDTYIETCRTYFPLSVKNFSPDNGSGKCEYLCSLTTNDKKEWLSARQQQGANWQSETQMRCLHVIDRVLVLVAALSETDTYAQSLSLPPLLLCRAFPPSPPLLLLLPFSLHLLPLSFLSPSLIFSALTLARPLISTAMSAYPRLDPYRQSRYEHGIDAKVVVMGNSGESHFLVSAIPALSYNRRASPSALLTRRRQDEPLTTIYSK